MFKRKTELCPTFQVKPTKLKKSTPVLTLLMQPIANPLIFEPASPQNGKHFKENINESLHFMS